MKSVMLQCDVGGCPNKLSVNVKDKNIRAAIHKLMDMARSLGWKYKKKDDIDLCPQHAEEDPLHDYSGLTGG